MEPTLSNLEKLFGTIEGAEEELLPPASDAQIDNVEEQLGVKFPQDLRTFYKWHNGCTGILFLFGEYRFYSLDEVVRIYQANIDATSEDDFEIFDDSDAVKECYANTKWIPIGDNGGNTTVLLDLDPGTGGTLGQMIEACDGEPECQFPSLDALLCDALLSINNGELSWDRDAGCWM